MKKIFLILLFLCCFLPAFSHGDDEGFEAKQEKIKVNKVGMKVLNVETATIKEIEVDEKVRTTGQIEEIPTNHFDVNTPVQGRVSSILVKLGDRVRAGQGLAVIESTEIAKLQADIDQLKAELELAQNNYDREKVLFEKRISPQKDVQAAKTFLASQEVKLNAAQTNLQILTQQSANVSAGAFTVRAQKSGTIVENKITVGQVVGSDQLLFHAIDLSTVWASADIYEKDLGKVKLGQKVFVTLDGIPDKIFEGKLTYIGSVINQDTRTLPVKALLINQDELLKPGAFLQLAIHTGQKKTSVIVPKTALIERDKEGVEGKHDHLVYIKNEDKFIPRKIQVESHDSDSVEVLSGLSAGNIIVTNGAYQLQYGEGEYSNHGEHGHEHEGQSKGIPIWVVVGIGLLALTIGILIGKKK
jgi:cobalt-zinc-cadmium efflux system membrane fusion protein